MGTFNTKKTLYGTASIIPEIATAIRDDFAKEGYEVSMDALSSGGYDISITKGGLFKAVLGMKTALKITLIPFDGKIRFEAGVGIFGQQAIPTVISMFFFWPVLLTQIWGLIAQSKLDDRALKQLHSPPRPWLRHLQILHLLRGTRRRTGKILSAVWGEGVKRIMIQ